MTNLQQQFDAKLREVPIPADMIHVFGTIRTNVHIRTLGEDSARKWAAVLVQVLPGCTVRMVRTQWEAKENKNTCLLPTMRYGWLITAVA